MTKSFLIKIIIQSPFPLFIARKGHFKFKGYFETLEIESPYKCDQNFYHQRCLQLHISAIHEGTKEIWKHQKTFKTFEKLFSAGLRPAET